MTIAAGWRHDETDDEALRRHLGPDVVVLPLYTWFEVLMKELPDLAGHYQRRQNKLKEAKRLHRLRLDPALAAVESLLREEGAMAERELELAFGVVRSIDSQLLVWRREIMEEHEELLEPWRNWDAVRRMTDRAAEALAGARAIVVTGGHVAVLRNRMALFGAQVSLGAAIESGKPVFCWSAGAMVLSDRVVLYYDDPPDGPTRPEILAEGFGIVPNVVFLPHASERLRLDDEQRVAMLARRFAPASCIGLENGSSVRLVDGTWRQDGVAGTATLLTGTGEVTALEGQA